MARHVWSVYTTAAAIDNVSNNVSMFEVIEQLRLPSPPEDVDRFVLPMRSTMVTLWARGDVDVPERAVGRVRLLAPNGDQFGQWTHEVDLVQHLRTRNRAVFHTLLLSTPGVYEWEVAHAPIDQPDEWQVDASIPVLVVFEELEPGEDGDA